MNAVSESKEKIKVITYTTRTIATAHDEVNRANCSTTTELQRIFKK
jgi:hypothetical protein